MAVSRTPKGNLLFSGELSVYEEQLLYKRTNAGPKTIAKAVPKKRKSVKKEGCDDWKEKQQIFLERAASVLAERVLQLDDIVQQRIYISLERLYFEKEDPCKPQIRARAGAS